MVDTQEHMFKPPRPTAQRPLLGNTVLVVEDSSYASEAMRLLCLRSGARIRRATSLETAHKHLKVYLPNVVIIDLGLPDGSGAELIQELAIARSQGPIILGMSGDPELETVAIEAGADAFIEKPISSIAAFQQIILSRLPADIEQPKMRTLTNDEVEPDPIALQDDFTHIADLLALDPEVEKLSYITKFAEGLGRAAGDTEIKRAARALRAQCDQGDSWADEMARLEQLIQTRISQKTAV